MFKDLDTLKTQGEVKAVRNQFIHQAQSLCTYFNALSKSLTDIQEDTNEEIKASVDNINSIAEKISVLNKQINNIEVRGGHANELRDQRANLIDELSGIADVETKEFEVTNSNGQNLGGTNYRVYINGQTLVDGNDYRTLKCTSSKYLNNQMDAEGMYAITWEDTGMEAAVRLLLNRPEGTISRSDVWDLNTLTITERTMFEGDSGTTTIVTVTAQQGDACNIVGLAGCKDLVAHSLVERLAVPEIPCHLVEAARAVVPAARNKDAGAHPRPIGNVVILNCCVIHR